MRVFVDLERYGSPETRQIDIDIEPLVKKELAAEINHVAGYSSDAVDEAEIDYYATTKEMVADNF